MRTITDISLSILSSIGEAKGMIKKDAKTHIRNTFQWDLNMDLNVKNISFNENNAVIELSTKELSNYDRDLLFDLGFTLMKPYSPWILKYDMEKNKKLLEEQIAIEKENERESNSIILCRMQIVYDRLMENKCREDYLNIVNDSLLKEIIEYYSQETDQFIPYIYEWICMKGDDKFYFKIITSNFNDKEVRFIEMIGFECVDYCKNEYAFKYCFSDVNEKIKELKKKC